MELSGAGPKSETAIDISHLTRQTLGDTSLQREILDLFRVQASILVERLRVTREPEDRIFLAHTIKGSARAIGAWRVVEAAAAIEEGRADEMSVDVAIEEANRRIEQLLAA